MKLLEADPVAAPEAATQAPGEAPVEPPASPPEGGTLCKTCGAPMEAEQDWCLTCGTAAPGRLGERPGWRAATVVIGLTLLLVLGAILAGYAALTGDGAKPATTTPTTPATVPPVAEVPPAATTTPPAASTETTPPTTSSTPKSSVPKVTPPSSTSTPTTPVTPVIPPATSSDSTPSTSTPSTDTDTDTTPSTSTPSTSTSTTPAPAPIELADDAAKSYDPYLQAAATGDPAKALDGDGTTSWYVDPKDPTKPSTGLVVDVGKLQGIRELQITTPTPGFKVEIYANDEATPPPSITDTRWSHIKDVDGVGTDGDGTQKIVLGAGTSKYRNVLLWFTGPPSEGTRIRLTSVELLG